MRRWRVSRRPCIGPILKPEVLPWPCLVDRGAYNISRLKDRLGLLVFPILKRGRSGLLDLWEGLGGWQ